MLLVLFHSRDKNHRQTPPGITRAKILVLDIVHLDTITRLAGEDQYLAGDVGSAQVEPRVGLCVSLVLGLPDDIGKRSGPVVID